MKNLISPEFMPHGMCYAWKPEVLFLNVVSDALVAAAYLSIPFALLVFIKKREDLEFSWIFRLFAAFIFWCAMTHIMGIWVVWNPDYFAQGMVKMITAIVSLITAFMLWSLLPKALALPSPTSINRVNKQLRHEVNERQNAQQQLEEMNATLEQRVHERTSELEKINVKLQLSNQSLEEFAYAATHDLKEPLRGIKTHASYLKNQFDGDFPEEAKQKIERINELTTRMQNLMNSLLLYSKFGSGEMTLNRVNTGELVQEIRETLEVMLSERNAELIIDDNMPVVNADRSRLMTVFQNLVVNGLKFNESEKPIIEVGTETSRKTLKSVPEQVNEVDTIFYVRDNGVGIPERHHGRIFRIFKRLHADSEYGGGSGAGLTIIKHIIERHGGSIWLESDGKSGTTFYFSIAAG